MTGVSAAEVSALSEASQIMYGALKTECINAVQLASKTGLPPESFAGLANIIREFPETLVTGLQFGTGEAQKLFKFALNDQELVTSNYLGKSIAERIKTFAKRFTEKQTGKRSKILETGARRVAPLNECEAELIWAPKKYEEFRASTKDIDAIVKNTGIPKYKIEKIKHHIFYDDTHILREGIGRFAPDSEIASAWDRLMTGDFVANDLKLLEHEYFESKFEKIFKTDYDTAHTKTINSKQKGGKDREWNPANNE